MDGGLFSRTMVSADLNTYSSNFKHSGKYLAAAVHRCKYHQIAPHRSGIEVFSYNASPSVVDDETVVWECLQTDKFQLIVESIFIGRYGVDLFEQT